MKKTMITKAIAAVLAATGLVTTSVFATDRQIYQRGGEGSSAIMLMLDVSEQMRAIAGETNDGLDDYDRCRQTLSGSTQTIGFETEDENIQGVGKFKVSFCRYRASTINSFEFGSKLSEYFFPGKYKSYLDYIQKTCKYRGANTSVEYICYDRLSKAKIALLSLLAGNVDKGIARLTDDKVIGLSTFSGYHQSSNKNSSFAGVVNIPARRLDAIVPGTTLTQRQYLINNIRTIDDKLNESWLEEIGGAFDNKRDSNRPLASAYAETAAYLMGTTTKNSGIRVIARKDQMFVNDYFYVCKGYDPDKNKNKATWDEDGYCKSGWKRENRSRVLAGFSKDDLEKWIQKNYTSDGTYLRNDYPVSGEDLDDDDKKAFLTAQYYYVGNANDNLVNYISNPYSGFDYSSSDTRNSDRYNAPQLIKNQINNPATKACHAQGIYILTAGDPNIQNSESAGYSSEVGVEMLMKRVLAKNTPLNNSFSCRGSDKTLEDADRSGVGLTKDNALWNCISSFTAALKDPNKNPAGLNIKTAIAGTGRYYSDVPTTVGLDLENSQVLSQYNQKVDSSNLSKKFFEIMPQATEHNVKNMAKFGALGQGGFYSALSVEEIAESVNHFINYMAKDIPSASVNKATIPVDILNPYELQPYAYLSMYEPAVQQTTAAWAGNLKRYKVGTGGAIVDEAGVNIFGSDGLVKDTAKDSWENSTLTDSEKLKQRIFQGGALNRLDLTRSDTSLSKRKIYTTRDCSTTGDKVTCKQDDTLKLSVLNKSYFEADSNKKDNLRGYLLALLGYDVTNPNNVDDEDILSVWKQQPELRQMGAILHSDPVLLTQKGTVVRDGKNISTIDRDDYVLFGTTQGLLHVVNADTGEEKFAFVPNEMVEKNHIAFANPSLSSASLDFLYGIDAPWTAYTEYVSTKNDSATVTVKEDAIDGAIGKQWVYGGLGMGGYSYYALDLTDLEQPTVKFHIDPDNKQIVNEAGAVTYEALKYMGKSWSKPVITRVYWEGEEKLVMFVGGGYDGNLLDESSTMGNSGYESALYTQNNGRGSGVYMFDADDGKLLWWASAKAPVATGKTENTTKINNHNVVSHHVPNMQYSVVSTIKTVDRDGDNLTDHLYFGDLGGQVWRIDINNFRRENQSFATHAVRLLHHDNLVPAEEKYKRPRFYVQPTFSIYREPKSGEVLAAVSIGSGNASVPLHYIKTAEETTDQVADNANWVENAIYTILDPDVTKSNLYSLSAQQLKHDLDINELDSGIRTGQNTANKEKYQFGWKYTFSKNAFKFKEQDTQNFYSRPMAAKVITDPVLMNNQLFVSVFDGAKAGTVQGCDAGIRGESVIERFCMPYGYCATDSTLKGLSNRFYAGVGIAPINISSAGQGDQNSRTLLNTQCQGDNCSATNADTNQSKNKLHRKLSPMRWFERE